MNAATTIDIPRLFKLRAAVGRFGEMDGAGWWNTQGVLGPRGAVVYKRGLPRTHFLARVRVVATVAAERSRTIYPSPGVATLWSLPPAIERALSFRERAWATNGSDTEWAEFEVAIVSPPTGDLSGWLVTLGLVDQVVEEQVAALASAPGGKGVTVPGPVDDKAIQLLAAGHGRGAPRELVVPFVQDGLESGLD
jgi:hypothetical protein